MKNISVILTTYRRYDSLQEIITAWSLQADEVILANGGRYFESDIPVKQILFTPDPGNRIRFIAGYLAKNKYIIMADDDIIPEPGLADKMFHAHVMNGFQFVGLYGMDFIHPDRYMKNPNIRSDRIREDFVRTDYVGVVYMTTKEILFRRKFDPMDIPHRSVDDLYFQCKVNGDLKKGVVKTDLYRDLSMPRSDDGAICRDPECKAFRREYASQFKSWRENES